MYRMIICLGLLLSFLTPASSNTRGAAVSSRQILTNQHGDFNLYNASHALLIGNIDYQYWDKLPSIRQELKGVGALLKNQGFTVDTHWDLSSNQLSETIKDFLNRYGAGEKNRDNRLVIFFSGHGETLQGFNVKEQKGFIVPIDSPTLYSDKIGFLDKALSMADIVNLSTNVSNKHILFLFDSCFSGSILETGRSSKQLPPIIHESIKNPVRQFITAGNASEKVPATSRFVPAFIRAIKEQAADFNHDNYVTGTELAMYLANEVPKYTNRRNHPQVGTMGNGESSDGDVVFALDNVFLPEKLNNEVRLTIKTSPENARIRILNIIPKYRDGMLLKPHKSYEIEATHPDYQRMLKIVSFKTGGEQVMSMMLERGNSPKPKPKPKSKGEVFTGSAAHFTDNGDGTVNDSNTGLQWMRCALGQTWRNNTCEGKAKKYPWQAALDKAKDYRYAGYSNWRVPTIKELNSLVYCSNGKLRAFNANGWQTVKKEGAYGCGSDSKGSYQRPTLEQQVFPNSGYGFWSSSPGAVSSGNAWAVLFGNGSDSSNIRFNVVNVRLVR